MTRVEIERELGWVRDGLRRLVGLRLTAPLTDHEETLYRELIAREEGLLTALAGLSLFAPLG